MEDGIGNKVKEGSLLLYKSAPAKVLKIKGKIEIELVDKKTVQVRQKDVVFLHPGPVSSLSVLINTEKLPDKLEEACSILQGETVTLKELAELSYEEYTVETAWLVCSHLLDSLYISGSADEIIIRDKADVEKDRASRRMKSEEKERWSDFTLRARDGNITEKDNVYMRDLELFALGKGRGSRLLKDLKIAETVENAHALLLKLNYWDYSVNPYISRFGFSTENNYPDADLLENNILSGERLNLCHLESYAVDDEGNTDPDDAVSYDDGKLWVHVADPSYAVFPGSDADNFAINQGANIYLPEIKIPMLNPAYTEYLGLGLKAESPALSFCIKQKDDGSIINCGIFFTKISVKRITYQQAQQLLDTHPFNKIFEITNKHKKYRTSRGASFFKFPEVSIKVEKNIVSISPRRSYDSSEMIMESMLMAGESASSYTAEKGIPFIYSTQSVKPENESEAVNSESLSEMFDRRRKMSAGIVKSHPDEHSGLGLASYSRVTSPLRRYLDLAAHQQLRLSLEGKTLLSDDDIISRIGQASAGASAVQKLERASNMHWTLVYLLQNPGWEGKGIIVDKRERSDTVLIPELGFETQIPAQKSRVPDEEIMLKVTGIDLPKLNAFFSPV